MSKVKKPKEETPSGTIRKPKDRTPINGFRNYKPMQKIIFFMALVVSNETRSGSIGDTVYSRNTYGNYVRQRTKPVFPETELQMATNARFGSQSQAWRGITAIQRAAWEAMSSTVSFTNRLGQSIFLKGQAMFNKLNMNLLNAGQAAITAAPAYTVPAAPLTVTGTATAGVPSLNIAYTPTPVPVGVVYQFWATPQMSAGRTFSKSEFRLIANVAAASASPLNMLTAYTTQFGIMIVGLKFQVKVRAVSTSTGVASAFIKDIVTVGV